MSDEGFGDLEWNGQSHLMSDEGFGYLNARPIPWHPYMSIYSIHLHISSLHELNGSDYEGFEDLKKVRHLMEDTTMNFETMVFGAEPMVKPQLAQQAGYAEGRTHRTTQAES